MQIKFFPGLAVVVFSLSVCGFARAQGDDMKGAKEAYSIGQKLFYQEKYEEALEAFKESMKAFPHYRTIFNIALCHEKLGDIKAAVDMYTRYIQWPDVANKKEVEKKLAELQGLLPPEPESEPEPDPEPEPEPASAEKSETEALVGDNDEQDPELKIPGWIVLGVGSAATISGGVLIGLAVGDADTMRKIEANGGYDSDKHEQLPEHGRNLEVAGWVSGTVGLAMVATGIVMLAVSKDKEKQTDKKLAVTVAPTEEGFVAVAGWSF